MSGARSTTDLLILMVAGTICGAVLLATVSIGLIELANPEADSSAAMVALGAVLNTLVGLLAGYLAGHTQRVRSQKPPTARRAFDDTVEQERVDES